MCIDTVRCGGLFNNKVTTNLLLSLQVKNFENRTIFDEVTGKNVVSSFFIGHSVVKCAEPSRSGLIPPRAATPKALKLEKKLATRTKPTE